MPNVSVRIRNTGKQNTMFARLIRVGTGCHREDKELLPFAVLMLFQPHIKKKERNTIKIPVLVTAGQSGIYENPALYEKIADDFFEI